MVRLKVPHFGKLFFSVPKFQFQYGSIKSMSGYKEHSDVAKFQFQYGSIKRIWVLVYWQTHITHFNSNMVRLKEIWNSDPELQTEISIPIWFD